MQAAERPRDKEGNAGAPPAACDPAFSPVPPHVYFLTMTLTSRWIRGLSAAAGLIPALSAAAVLIPALSAIGAQAPPPSVTIPRIETSITIDAVLDESVWSQAVRLDGFYQYRPVDSRPAEDSTVVLLWYAPDAIHVGILAYDRQPETVRATLSDRDNIDSDDQVTIYLDTFNDRRRAYFFGVNPLGVQDDGMRAEGGFSTSGFGSGTVDRNPDFLWQSKGRKTEFGWVAEIRIPFKSLRWGGGGEMTWGFNVQRTTRRTGYEDTWTDVRRANASFLGQSGSITGIQDIHRGVVTEFQPTVVANAPGRRLTDGRYQRDDIAAELGANLRLGFTSLTLDATYNPDFSQVESDVGLVTINERFALFFPERRPFFLEGIDLFSSPNNLVYTRTVANPLAGAKITGKFGAWSLAHLTALDEFSQSGNLDTDQKALVNITRVRRDIGSGSVAGLTLTNRDEDGNFNRVLAADARLIFGGMYYFAAQAGMAVTNNLEGDVAADEVGGLWEVEVDRTGRGWGFNYKLTGIGEDFETWSGFVNRTGIVTGRAFNRLTAYGKRGALVEQVQFFGGGSRIWSSDNALGSGALEGSEELNGSARLRGGWELNGSAEHGFVRFANDDYAVYQVAGDTGPEPFPLATGVFDVFSGQLRVTTPTFLSWDANASVQFGETAIFPEAAPGRFTSASLTLNHRPTSAIRLGLSLTAQQLRRARDGSEFGRTILPRLKVEVQPNRALFFRFVGEYRSERQAAPVDPISGRPILIGSAPGSASATDRLRMDLLASYEPTAGTVFFLGYGSSLRGERPLTFRMLERQDDALFLKAAYLFRW